MIQAIMKLSTSVILFTSTILSNQTETAISNPPVVIASQEFSLENRYREQSVNDIFVDNILLTLLYMENKVEKGQNIDWNMVRQPGKTDFVLNPGDTFAFHDKFTQEYQGKVSQTTNAHFNSLEGFKSDGFIVGDGVCHLASFMHVVANKAGLDVSAPVRHDFAPIPDVDKEYGTSINSGDIRQNMYITNTTDKPIAFTFNYTEDSLKIDIVSIS